MKTSSPSDYVVARDLATTFGRAVGLDTASDIAGRYLDKIGANIDPGTALQEAMSEGIPVATFPSSPPVI